MLKKSFASIFLFLSLGPLPGADWGQIHHTVLQNGLTVVAIENATVPLVTIEMDVRNGAFTEPPQYNGLSHLFEHMFFKANKLIPDQQRFLQRATELAIVFNASTSEERVNYHFTTLKDSLAPGLALMKAAITTPLFLQEELERERIVVIDEYNRNESDPFFHLEQEVNKRLWYRYFSRKNVIGDREVILTADQDKMHTIHKKYYIPNNAALLIAGAVKHEQVFELAREYFSDWQKGPRPFPLDPFAKDAIPYHPGLDASKTVIVEKPVNAITIMLRWQGPSVSVHTDDTYTADLLAFIMNLNSKFPRILVSSGLFTRVSFSYYTLDQKGPITITAQTTRDKFPQANRALFEEIKYMISDGYFTDEQIEYAKQRMEVRERYDWEQPSSFVQRVGFWWSITGSLDYYNHYLENIRKVTRYDINNFVKNYIQNAPYVMGILISREDREALDL